MRYLFSFILLGFVLVPEVASAQLVSCTGVDCNFCHFVQTIDNINTWIISIATLLAVMVMIYAGFRIASSRGDVSAVQEGKKLLINSIIGFIIILSAFVIVETILMAVVNPSSLKLSDVKQIWTPTDCGGLVDPTHALDVYDPTADISVVPSGTTGSYCGISAPTVVPIPGEPGDSATQDTVTRFVAMRTAAAAAGITLTVNEAYRSDATQVQYWNARGCDVDPSLCSGKVARPCSLGGNGSNHQKGIALDLNTPFNSTAFNWLKTNGGTYGFYNNLGSVDPWHWSPSGR